MKRIIAIAGIAATLALVGCAGATWNVKATCKTDGDCQVEGSIGGTIPGGGSNGRLADKMLASSAPWDAADFVLDVSGSTVHYPSTGRVTLTLIDRSTDVVQAARQFDWVRNGSILRLVDPDTVNAWAATEGGTANDLTYKLARFETGAPPGDHIASVKSKYQGQVTASATTHFSVCTPYPSPYQCMQ